MASCVSGALLMNDPVLLKPIDAVVFDCDGTLSKIEDITDLAEMNDVGEVVAKLTEEAMATTGISPELYAKRLNMIHPSKKQIALMADHYYQERVTGVESLLACLLQLNKVIYVVSAGIAEAVKAFAARLQITEANVFAVEVYFDAAGDYKDFDHDSLLIQNCGKRQVVNELLQQYPRIVYVGDGQNDLCCLDIVTRFIGFGGVSYRDSIKNACDFYVTSEDISSILPLILTHEELSLHC